MGRSTCNVWSSTDCDHSIDLGKHTLADTFLTESQLFGRSQCDEEGDLVMSTAGEGPTLKALEEAEILVFKKGPRAGFDYEEDAFWLETPLLVDGAK